jgi:hypothetical protein
MPKADGVRLRKFSSRNTSCELFLMYLSFVYFSSLAGYCSYHCLQRPWIDEKILASQPLGKSPLKQYPELKVRQFFVPTLSIYASFVSKRAITFSASSVIYFLRLICSSSSVSLNIKRWPLLTSPERTVSSRFL